MKLKPILWRTISVDVSKIKPTPNNFKLKTEEGTARFNTSVEKYGLAGTVILNKDFTLIDGNTRWEKAKDKKLKKIDASMPDRQLTKKEFTEFAAMYDFARAGEVDIDRIKNELGTSEEFFQLWNVTLPKESIVKLEEMEANEGKINPTQAKTKNDYKETELSRITLLFNKDEYQEYIQIAESLYARFKVDNITDLSIAVARFVKKNLNGKIK